MEEEVLGREKIELEGLVKKHVYKPIKKLRWEGRIPRRVARPVGQTVITEAIRKLGKAKQKQIIETAGYSRATIFRDLDDLRHDGRIEKQLTDEGLFYVVAQELNHPIWQLLDDFEISTYSVAESARLLQESPKGWTLKEPKFAFQMKMED